MTWRLSSYLFTYLCLSIDSHWTGTSMDMLLNLNLTSQNIYSTLMCGLRIFLLGPLYASYRVTSYLRLLALSVLTCSHNMSFLARLVSDTSRSLEKYELGIPSSPVTHKEIISARDPSLVHSYLRVRFDFPGSINLHCFWDIAFDMSNVAIFGYFSCV